MVINTYKITVEANVQAESEEAAKNCCIDLLNSPQATNPKTGAPSGVSDARIAAINNVECECLFEDKNQNEESTNQKKEEEKLANEQLKELEKGGSKQVEQPDEVAITDPNTGTGKLVENPNKGQPTAAEVEAEKNRKQQEEDSKTQQQQGQGKAGRPKKED
jgi:hypothetical protein